MIDLVSKLLYMPHHYPRQLMRTTLVGRPFPTVAGLRPPSDADVQSLASLMYRAYRSTIDDHDETEADALSEVQKTLSGSYGMFNPSCSTVVERDSRLISACLITHYQERPFVAFSMTDADFKRNGLARACLVAAMSRLHAAGEREVRLVVTLGNLPALHLYQSLGFVVEG
jgi:RimJ/RimL family protein N-acetyltransferase